MDRAADRPVTGRVFVFVTRDSAPQPRFQGGALGLMLRSSARDVSRLAPGMRSTWSTEDRQGFPVRDAWPTLPAGRLLRAGNDQRLHEFHAPMATRSGPTWTSGRDNTSHGRRATLVSAVQRVHVDPATQGIDIRCTTSTVIPPVGPGRHQWVKRVKIQSDILTKFWGHPMYLGAVRPAAQGYDEHPTVHYPVVYEQGHFQLSAALSGFTTDAHRAPDRRSARRQARTRPEPGYEFYKEWTARVVPADDRDHASSTPRPISTTPTP